eukprot:SAG11_NODE_46942_length_132_cov_399.424242_1_plen_44_part_11
MLQIQGNPEQRHDLTLTHAEAQSSIDFGGDLAADGTDIQDTGGG